MRGLLPVLKAIGIVAAGWLLAALLGLVVIEAVESLLEVRAEAGDSDEAVFPRCSAVASQPMAAELGAFFGEGE